MGGDIGRSVHENWWGVGKEPAECADAVVAARWDLGVCGHKFSFAGDVVGANAFAFVGTRLDRTLEAYHFDFLIHTSISAGPLTSRVKKGAEFLEFAEFVGVLNGMAELSFLKLRGGK